MGSYTSFIQKIKDAFFVFAGVIWGGESTRSSSVSFEGLINDSKSASEIRNHNYAGIFDYVTLFIPRLINYLFELAWVESNHPFFNFLGVLLFIFLDGPLLLTRYLVAGVLTLASIPIIGAVEVVSYFMEDGGKELEEKVLDLTVNILEGEVPPGYTFVGAVTTDLKETPILERGATVDLKRLLSIYPDLTLEDVLIKISRYFDADSKQETVAVVIQRPAGSKSHFGDMSTDPVSIGSFSLPIFQKDTPNDSQKEGLKAMLKLGLKSTDFMRTSVTDKLEKNNPELLNSLTSP